MNFALKLINCFFFLVYGQKLGYNLKSTFFMEGRLKVQYMKEKKYIVSNSTHSQKSYQIPSTYAVIDYVDDVNYSKRHSF